MRIFFERTGGFASIKLQRTLDSSELAAGEAKRLDSLLKKSRFFELPARLESASPGADRFHYKLTVEDDQGVRTVEASDASVPVELRPLIDWLTSLSRR
jgi:hypothetical protein